METSARWDILAAGCRPIRLGDFQDMAGELPVDLRTWRKGDDRGRGVPSDGAGAASPNGSGKRPSLGSRAPQSPQQKPAGEPEGAQTSPVTSGVQSGASPQAGLEGEKIAETNLPLRKRRFYAMQGGNGESQGPLAGKVPKTENGEDLNSWGSSCNGCCPSYVPVGYPRLPAAYYPGRCPVAGIFPCAVPRKRESLFDLVPASFSTNA